MLDYPIRPFEAIVLEDASETKEDQKMKGKDDALPCGHEARDTENGS